MKCCDYTTGMLRHAIAFQRVTRTSNGAGGFTEAIPTSISGSPTRGRMKALSGSERYASDRVEARARYRLVTRYFAGLLESDTVLHEGRRYNIRFINNVDFADKWLEVDLDGGVAC